MAQNRLHFNVDDLNAQSEKLYKAAQDIQDSKTELINSLAELQTDWVSTASTKFFEKVDTDWTVVVDKYIDMLDQLAQELAWSANEYEPLVDEYNDLELS